MLHKIEILKREAERQRLEREELEMELQDISQRLKREELEIELQDMRQQMQCVKNNDADMGRFVGVQIPNNKVYSIVPHINAHTSNIFRKLDDKEKALEETLQHVQVLEKEIAARDAEVNWFPLLMERVTKIFFRAISGPILLSSCNLWQN